MDNNTKKCKHCGTDMDANVKICPNCKKRQKLAWWQIALIVLAILIVISALGSSGKENNGNGTTPENNDSNVVTEENNNENNAGQGKKATYSVGETFSDGYMSVKYYSLDDNFTNYSSYATVKSGYKIICASFEFENVSSTDQLASSYDFNCYADGYDCESFWSVEDSIFSANLSAGKKTKGNVYFEVPVEATSIVIEYENNIWTSNKVKFVVK